VHGGVKQKEEKKEEYKIKKEDLIELARAQNESEEEEEEAPEISQEEKNFITKKKTENMRDVIARQRIEFVEKPIYHKDNTTQGSVQFTNAYFKKRTANRKRKVPESNLKE